MELSFEVIQKKIKKERKENLEILDGVQKRLEKEVNKINKKSKPPGIHLIDFIRTLAEEGNFKETPSDILINLIDCISDYIITVRSILTASVQLTAELDQIQDVQEKLFRRHGDEVKIIKEPEELKKVETDTMDDVRKLYKEINLILTPLMEGKGCSPSLYFEDVINELIKMGQLSMLNKEKLQRLLVLNIKLVKKWLIQKRISAIQPTCLQRDNTCFTVARNSPCVQCSTVLRNCIRASRRLWRICAPGFTKGPTAGP